VIFKNIGLYKKETSKPNQNELHSGQDSGFLIYGIYDNLLRIGLKISEKLYIYDTLKLKHTKYSKLKRYIKTQN